MKYLLGIVFQTMAGIGGFATITVIAAISLNEFRQDAIFVNPFSVPEEMVKNGYTGTNLANGLIDGMRVIRNVIRTAKFVGVQDYPIREARPPLEVDFNLPETGVSLRALIQYLRRELRIERPHVSGEVVRADDKVFLYVRVLGRSTKIEGKLGNLDPLLFEAAKYVYRVTQPIVFAFYTCTTASERCEEALKAVLALGSEDERIWAYSLLGSIYSDKRQFMTADSYFRRATENNVAKRPQPNKLSTARAQAYVNWGVSLSQRGHFNDAQEKFKAALQGLKEHSDAYAAWADSLLVSGRAKEAIEMAEKAVRYGAERAMAYHVLGRALFMEGRHDEAIRKLERTIELAADDPRAHFFLGEAFRHRKEYQQAERMLRKSVELYGAASVEHHIALGLSLAGQGKHREAVGEFLMAFDRNCDAPEAVKHNLVCALERAKSDGLNSKISRRCLSRVQAERLPAGVTCP